VIRFLSNAQEELDMTTLAQSFSHMAEVYDVHAEMAREKADNAKSDLLDTDTGLSKVDRQRLNDVFNEYKSPMAQAEAVARLAKDFREMFKKLIKLAADTKSSGAGEFMDNETYQTEGKKRLWLVWLLGELHDALLAIDAAEAAATYNRRVAEAYQAAGM
jgi:hypothetical protein